ncbi:MAG: hypothetical protein M9916_10005 [Crocinitomicaceae bacterium]|nr:hypothetical protein [Crocinitomicaceae bacterium]
MNQTKLSLAKKWFLIGLLNLAIVALYGSLMRYKIAFDFPFFHQKYLLHAHSHFAFSGWISHIIYSGIVLVIMDHLKPEQIKKYKYLINFNLFVSFGMLISFTIVGYKSIAIVFSSLSIVMAVLFTFAYFGDKKYLPITHPSRRWILSGLALNILSALGPLYLAYMIVTKTITSDLYLGSLYYYLHFQYNGWFFFGAMSLIVYALPKGFPNLNKYYWVFISTVIPTFLLSVLWSMPPMWLYLLTLFAALLEMGVWIYMLFKLAPDFKKIKFGTPKWVNYILYFVIFAMTLKFVLQTLSVIPSLSRLVFGIRPIVIAYLHLVLLGVYSLFILGYGFLKGFLRPTPFAKIGAITFFIGVFLNELFLAIQGFSAFAYVVVPFNNYFLFTAALILLLGALLLFISQIKATNHTLLNTPHHPDNE